jgi:hypothetical protein
MSSRASSLLSDYRQINTIPASVSALFLVSSLYLFGGMGTVNVEWISYTLSTQHALMVTLGAYVVAFMSSATDDFRDYMGWEQFFIVAGPAVTAGWEYVAQFHDFMIGLGDPLGAQIAFAITVLSWGVIAR